MLKVVCLSVEVRGRDGGLPQNFLSASPEKPASTYIVIVVLFLYSSVAELFLWKHSNRGTLEPISVVNFLTSCKVLNGGIHSLFPLLIEDDGV